MVRQRARPARFPVHRVHSISMATLTLRSAGLSPHLLFLPPPPRLFPPKPHRVKVQLRSKVFSVGKAAGLELPEAHEGQCPARRSLHCPSAWPRSPGQTQPCAAQWLCGDCFSISEPSDSIEAESDTHTLVSYLWRPAPLGDTLGTRQALQSDAQERLILEAAVTRTAVTLPQAQETSGLSPLSPLWR